MKLKVMTYNIQHGLDYAVRKATGEMKIVFDPFADFINETDADVIGLNEIRDKGTDPEYTEQAKILGEKTGRYHYFTKCIEFKGHGPYGHAALTKVPAEHTVIDIPDPEVRDEDVYYETRKISKLVLNLEKKVTVFTAHFGLAKSEKRNAVKTLLEEIKKVDTPIIFMGDLNMMPDNEILAPVYEVLNEVYGEGGPNSFPSIDPYEKIDYIFVSRDVKVLKAETPDKVISDHLPVIAELEI